MQIINSIAEFNTFRNKINKSVGFVPTMGALHEGHLSLVQYAKSQCKYVVVSIFVNPKQFAPSEDFNNYPRTIEQDIKKLRSLNIDVLFMPPETELYNADYPDINYHNNLFNILEGSSRPDFFKGVCMVVSKLFDITNPTHAFFGEKDFQQLRVIEKMVEDLNYNIHIVPCKIVREANGLAMSSRNKYLSNNQLQKSQIIFQTLKLGLETIQNGNKNIDQVYSILINNLKKEPEIVLDYLKIVDYDSLCEFKSSLGDKFTICIAVYLDGVRLIDNINYLFSEF